MNVRRIFCIGRNYADHINELGNVDDGECVVFMKPASCLVEAGQPIVLPRGRGVVHHEAELVVLLTGGGRDIPEDQASETIAGITLGLDLTLRELQSELKKKGAPWELSKAFDGAAPLGDWQPYLDQDLQAMNFELRVNGETRQLGDTSKMLFPVARLIHILSRTWSLEPGDAIYTGTPAGVAALSAGDILDLHGKALGHHRWQVE
jgi:2-keto-4-pentenoate hydratase/2-oxohepta-3-ene-1,7-dioic acid hydratase in catechol pathway